MNTTAKKAQSVSGEVHAPEKKPIIGQVVKIDARMQIPPIQSRIQKIAELSKKTVQLHKLKENLQDLEGFTFESDKVFECVRLSDNDGREWKTSNSFLLKKLVDSMVEEFRKKADEIESEILEASI